MKAAARIGAVYGLDPVRVLDEPDTFAWQIREASLTVWMEDQRAIFGGGDG